MRTRKLVKILARNSDNPSHWHIAATRLNKRFPTNEQIKNYLHMTRGDSYKIKLPLLAR